jgi:hypothetical protein
VEVHEEPLLVLIVPLGFPAFGDARRGRALDSLLAITSVPSESRLRIPEEGHSQPCCVFVKLC